MADWVMNTVYITASEEGVKDPVRTAECILRDAKVWDLQIVRKGLLGIIRFESPWEAPMEAARRIRSLLNEQLAGWFIRFEDDALGWIRHESSLLSAGFPRELTVMDDGFVPLDFSSRSGF